MRDFLNFFFPILQFRGLVEVVVTVIAAVAVEPLLVVAAVQADVSDTGGDMLGRGEGMPDLRLIDVSEASVLEHEFTNGIGIIPTLVPHFDNPRILDELPQQLLQIFTVEARVLERNRELDEQRAELSLR